jgi:uncharacterized protein YjdB
LTVTSKIKPEINVNPQQNIELRYSSSNEAVATVDKDGLITAVGIGEAIITAYATYRPDVSASITVNVLEAKEEPKPKGCFSKDLATLKVGSLSLIAILLVLKRRKH